MMQKGLININNATRATELLLTLDPSAVEKDYRPNAYRLFTALKEIADRHEEHLQKCYLVRFKEKSRSALVQHSLESLTHFTETMAQFLRPEAQNLLANWLTDPDMPLPNALFFEDKD